MFSFYDEKFIENAKDIFDYLHNGVVVVEITENDSIKLIYVNKLIAKLLGITTEEATEKYLNNPINMVYESDRPVLNENLLRNYHNEQNDYFTASYRFQKYDGEIIWVLGHMQFFIHNGRPIYVCLFTDVNELISAQINVEENSNNLWMDIVNNIPTGATIVSSTNDTFKIVAINDTLVKFAEKVGEMLDGNDRSWNKEALTMLLNQNIYAFCIEEDIHLVKEMMNASIVAPITETTFRLRGSTSHNPVYIHTTCSSRMVDENTRYYYILFTEITRTVLAEQELQANQIMLLHMSYYDKLTGFKNRNAYSEYTEACRIDKQKDVGIAFIDANGLKEANDQLGHSYGDRMLQIVSSLIKEEFSYTNVYRISGDEFVIVEPNINKEDFVAKILHVRDLLVENDDIASIGFVWKKSMSDLKRRVGQAEQLMYIEKQKYYERTAALQSKHRPRLLKLLLNDLENNQFVMFLQPKARIGSTKATGAEALVRRIGEDGKIIPPYEFIPQLEQEKLIPKIDFFMLEEVCKFLEELKKEGRTDFVVSVNMSRVTFEELDFISHVEEVCSKYDFNRSQLEFELTESNQTIDQIRFDDYIQKIKSLGISISLDDVGTDYASLRMLIIEGIDVLKIDRSLIVQIDKENTQVLLKHLNAMAHELGIKVLAEGVETDDVRQALEELNCDYYQGYLLSPPIPVDKFKQEFL
ncbi:MAG: EAL domain-containing protein [Lachnospiraceae bacterium]|nr:EAL domain-containing protein [Lachnospiraceae bacterium]